MNPLARQAVNVAIVESRNDLLFENVIQRLRIATIGDLVRNMLRAVTDREAIRAVVRFGPPAVEDRQVQAAIENYFLAARSRSFERPAWIVQPNVHTLHHVAGNIDVIVLDEHDLLRKPLIVPQVSHALDELLAGLVLRVCFAGEDELHGLVPAVEHLQDPFQVEQEKIGSLIGRESASESDRQRVWIEYVSSRFDGVLALLASSALPAEPTAHESEQQALQRIMRLPQFAGVDFVNFLPGRRLTHPARPTSRKMAVVQLAHLPRQPARHMHAVGDMPDRNFFFNTPRPKLRPHAATDMTMQVADRVRAP